MHTLTFLLVFISFGTLFSQNATFDDYYNSYPKVTIPKRYYLETDESGKIIGSPDSVLVVNQFKLVENPAQIRKGVRSILFSELIKCKNLLLFSTYLMDPKVSEIDFSNFPKLRSLNLDTHWTTKQMETLANKVKGLKHLTIGHDKPLPENLFQLEELSYLKIDQVGKTKLSANLSKMKSIKHVVISDYHTDSDEAIWNIPTLEVLQINQGDLIFPENRTYPKKLRFLELYHLDTLAFPSELKGLDSLNSLFIRDIYTTIHFNKGLNDLTGLKGLKINGCFLDSGPNISQMKNLEEFSITACRVKTYGLDFSNNQKLRYLFIANSYPTNEIISEFPKGLDRLTQLESLCLTYVVVNSLPSYFSKFKSLKYLALSHCKIDYNSILLLNSMTNLVYCSYQFAEGISQAKREELERSRKFRPLADFGAPSSGKINWEPKVDSYTLYNSK